MSRGRQGVTRRSVTDMEQTRTPDAPDPQTNPDPAPEVVPDPQVVPAVVPVVVPGEAVDPDAPQVDPDALAEAAGRADITRRSADRG